MCMEEFGEGLRVGGEEGGLRLESFPTGGLSLCS